jgi:hypothetical protein
MSVRIKVAIEPHEGLTLSSTVSTQLVVRKKTRRFQCTFGRQAPCQCGKPGNRQLGDDAGAYLWPAAGAVNFQLSLVSVYSMGNSNGHTMCDHRRSGSR